jgi:HD-like signal output (HDOD) protein
MIQKYFRDPAALPTMPELVSRLLRSIEREDLSLSEIVNLVARDPSLAVKLLRLANSPRFSPGREIATLRDAVNLLGMRVLRDLIMAACMAGMFPSRPGFDRVRFWRHGLATAGYSRILASATGVDPDTAYLAGLVMRTGRLLMLLVEPENVARTEFLAEAPDSLLAHERALLECTHLEVSAELARRWHFPPMLCAAMAAAADPLSAQPFSPLGAVLRLASTLADAGELGLSQVDALRALHAPLMERLSLDIDAQASELLPYEALTLGADQLVG